MISLSFTIWVTEDCNMACDYCYETKPKMSKIMGKNIIPKVIRFILDESKSQRAETCYINFHGGEPFLNKEVMYLLINGLNDAKEEIEFIFHVTTNATMLNEEDIIFIVRNIQNISVSIDGQKSTHDLHRRDQYNNSVFNKSFSNALKLLKYTSLVQVRMTVTPKTAESLYENIQYLIQSGFQRITPQMDIFTFNWDEQSLAQYKKQLKLAKSFLKNVNSNIEVDYVTPYTPVPRSKCDGGISSFQIDPEGLLYPCSVVFGDSNFICGTILSGINEEWIQKLDYINSISIKECEGCTYSRFCVTHKCKLFNYKTNGHYDIPSQTMCARENILYELNFKV